MYLVWSLLLYLQICIAQQKYQIHHLNFVILDQNEDSHIGEAQSLKKKIEIEANKINLKSSIFISSENFSGGFDWIYFPVIEKLSTLDAEWYIFIHEKCSLNLTKLSEALQRHDSNEMLLLFRRLHDSEPSIIHHFDSINRKRPFYFPDVRTGIILSQRAVIRLNSRIYLNKEIDFTIDAAYEFAKYCSQNGISLVGESTICIAPTPNCAIWQNEERLCEKVKKLSSQEGIYFAVKTCSKLSGQRLPILRDTWFKDAKNLDLFSDTTDKNAGTVSLGIPNTERGHCAKTLAIIKHANNIEQLEWLVIADDDTLLSVPRIIALLSCYNHSESLIIGERYGYRATGKMGYEYVTGGAGMVFTKSALKQLSEPGACECPSSDSPDDMILGICFKMLKIPIINNGRFHQARANDYSSSLLEYSKPISFHKFWLIEPRDSYKVYLQEVDKSSSLNEEL